MGKVFWMVFHVWYPAVVKNRGTKWAASDCIWFVSQHLTALGQAFNSCRPPASSSETIEKKYLPHRVGVKIRGDNVPRITTEPGCAAVQCQPASPLYLALLVCGV